MLKFVGSGQGSQPIAPRPTGVRYADQDPALVVWKKEYKLSNSNETARTK
jgi:hypothetical protein